MSKLHKRALIAIILAPIALFLVVGCGTGQSSFQEGAARPTKAEAEETKGEMFSAEDIAKTGATTAWEACARLVKYAVFTQTSRGEPDRIRRRGASSINLYEDMLVLVDGIRILDVRSLGDIPAGVISQIQVLSGLDGTTQYGSGAGDGVILISTRVRTP